MIRRSNGRSAFRVALLASTAFLLASNAAHAQDQAAPAEGDPQVEEPDEAQASSVDDIVVTGSRLGISGYQAPTPVTVVSAERLLRDAHTDLSSVLQNLPAVGPSISTNSGAATQSSSSGTAGLAIVNLRNLGAGRTLTLYDGVRVAPSGDGFGVDLNLLPSALVSRIDVVTGGASAAWGSDAVSGVVNVILNRDFDGLSVDIEGATNQLETRQSAKIDVTYGRDIGDRGKLILSGSYFNSPDLVIPTDTPWYNAQMLVNNPAYTPTNNEPRLIHVDRAGMHTATRGGVVVGPAGSPLLGYQFLDNGRPARFDFGRISGLVTTGGTYANPVLEGQFHSLTIPIENVQGFGFFSYDLTDSITARLEVNFAQSEMSNTSPTYARNVTIFRDNPYIDASLLPLLGTAPSFTIGTTNANNVNLAAGDDPQGEGVGLWGNRVTRELARVVFGLEGRFGEWDWNIDVQHSQSYRYTDSYRNPIVANYNLATDAVRVTSANVGTSGLAIGSIACRSRLTNPSNGCVPLNVLGTDVADPAAIAYIQGSGAWSELWQTQTTASAAVRGEPFSTWAGPVAVALGFDYRKEEYLQEADPLSYARAYSIGNFQFFDAEGDSSEIFAEANVPLLRDQVVQSLDFNAALRVTDYSTSGRVETWKIGATSQINDDIRVRATTSRDIRAPTLLQLFNPGSSQRQTVIDPANGSSVNIATLIRGNPNLVPEEADTFTAGIVLTPRFLPGFSASIDYYEIDISGAFATPNQGTILAECQAGSAQYCALVDRNSAGVLQSVTVASVNAASEVTAGWDFQADYRMEAWGGDLDFFVQGNYTTELAVDSFGVVREELNSLRGGTLAGPLEYRATYGANWRNDVFSVGAQIRHNGAAKLNQFWTAKDVDDNDIPAYAWLDLRASYFVRENVQAFIAVDNVFDRDPPIIPQTSTDAFSFFFAPTRTELYDFLGRSFRFGIRAKF
jgi:outer membrane receptor protein involved in Fe transport